MPSHEPPQVPPPFATFDLETAKVLPAETDPRAHLPLGIAVAAVRLPDGKVRFWHGGSPTASQKGPNQLGFSTAPAPRMSADECRTLVRDLEAIVASGTTLVTWNGAGFDFLVLAEESGLWEPCAALARSHVDLMFHFFCAQGYAVSLEAVGRPLGLAKAANLTGAEAPAAWQRGEHDRVKRYLAGDVEMTAAVHGAAARNRGLAWVTQRGATRRWSAPRLLTVAEALALPLPDTSWMDAPRRRDDFVGWMDRPPPAAR